VYEMSDAQTRSAVAWALEAGYRHIDTAEWYENEASVGDGLRDFLASPAGQGVSRGDIFVTSKLMHNRGYDATLRDLKASLRRAGLEYFDLYLLHAPSGGAALRKELWRAMVDAKRAGLAKSIGVSNFAREWGEIALTAAKHIEEIVARGDELPVVNQIDLHPFMRHAEYVANCRKHGILLEVGAGGRGLTAGVGAARARPALRAPRRRDGRGEVRQDARADPPPLGDAARVHCDPQVGVAEPHCGERPRVRLCAVRRGHGAGECEEDECAEDGLTPARCARREPRHGLGHYHCGLRRGRADASSIRLCMPYV
jgi:aryl-alcohol dehydrogenase-like predicted oxidoreductase